MSSPFQVVIRANRTEQVAADIRRKAARFTEKAARDIEGQASELCVAMGAVDTGNLLNSISSAPLNSDRSVWRVVAAAEYAAYVNFGTVRMAARPFFTTAVDKVRPVYLAAMRTLPGVS